MLPQSGGIETAAKYAPTLALAPFAPAFDPWWLVIIPAGLAVGLLARAGRMVSENRAWPEIRRDVFVSLLIGGANALLAALLIWRLNLSYLPGLVVSALCAFGGVKTIEGALRWGWRLAVTDLGRQRQRAAREAAIEHLSEEHRLRVLAEEVDRRLEERTKE